MTPRRSVRAAARRLYEEMAGKQTSVRQQEAPPTPDPSPPLAMLAGGGEKPDLMAHVRRMYEDSIIPVRDIARRAGVAERTLYKYARKNGWKPRYAWTPDGARPRARPGRPRWTQAQEKHHARAARFAPAKGAGGRFIRRDDIGEPFAQGIKATDPAGRAAAAKATADAARVAKRAELEAECHAAWQGTCEEMVRATNALKRLNRLTDDARKAGREIDPLEERIVWREIDIATGSWGAAQRCEEAARLALERFDAETAAAPVTSACAAPS
jgi:hypothetical protein